MTVFYIILLLILIPTIYYLWYISISPNSGPVYVPSKDKEVEKMIHMAGLKKGDVVFDLGSGDGRLLFAAAKKGATATGYEIDPFLVLQTKKRARQLHLTDKVDVKLKNMWDADFNEADVIFVYLFPKFLGKLQKLLEENLTHPVTVISNDYQFPNKKYSKKDGKVYLYKF